ncbi:hypothetical protein [Enterococcus sp. DIV0800]|uniref:hypothetical protein n=1 Tax=unclassified Enterococcus TaxID=2608891 RepID=UPI003D2FEADE
MAHHVARILKQRPNDILDHWGVAELLVAYGQYSNEDTYSNFLDWQRLEPDVKKTIEQPEEYSVYFLTPQDFEAHEEKGGE